MGVWRKKEKKNPNKTFFVAHTKKIEKSFSSRKITFNTSLHVQGLTSSPYNKNMRLKLHQKYANFSSAW